MYGEGATALTTDDSDDFRAIEQGSVSKPRAYLRIRAVPAVGFFLQNARPEIPKVDKAKKFLPRVGTWHPHSLPNRQA
jgi:hypothetical protein